MLISIRIDDEIIQAIDELRGDLTRSTYIRNVLKRNIEKIKESDTLQLLTSIMS